jgi:hypothetical protein
VTATAPPTIAPAPTPLPLGEQAKLYKLCVTPYNKDSTALNKQLESARTLSALKKAMKGYVASEITFASCLRAVPWSPDVAADARSLIKAVSTVQVTEQAMSTARSYAEFNEYYKPWHKQALAASSAANVLRGDIGLPPVG